MKDFARLGLLIVMLMFSVQANERAKKIVFERRLREKQRGQLFFNRSLTGTRSTAEVYGKAN